MSSAAVVIGALRVNKVVKGDILLQTLLTFQSSLFKFCIVHCFCIPLSGRQHTCDTSRVIREAPGNGADLPGSRKGRKTSRKLNIPVTSFFFQNCPFFARIYGTDLSKWLRD